MCIESEKSLNLKLKCNNKGGKYYEDDRFQGKSLEIYSATDSYDFRHLWSKTNLYRSEDQSIVLRVQKL